LYTEEDRRNLAALYREDDRLRAERQEELCQNELLYKTTTLPAPTLTPEPEPPLFLPKNRWTR
jgi:hypothetical protein